MNVIDSECSREACCGTRVGFANALTIWLNKPHVVNRRLCGSRLECFKLVTRACAFKVIEEVIESLCFNLNGYSLEGIVTQYSTDTIEKPVGDNVIEVNTNSVEGLADLSDNTIAVIVRQMLPKQPERHDTIPELVIFDNCGSTCTFIPLRRCDLRNSEKAVSPEVVYSFSFQDIDLTAKSICLSSSTSDCSKDSERRLSLTWINSHLLQKLARWSEQPSLRTDLRSLCLISIEDYSRLYSELKTKYGIPLAKNWPEKTNAQKYVFEDVAIATYLLLLWEDDRKKKGLEKKQSFVDLGCGNGLLVHILASEGYPGYGIDVRKRNIWDQYGPETVLKEVSITPSTESLFPHSDWLIGNHSDELTPWIPVIAARSSYTCNYFVLPCCTWDFNTRYNFTQRLFEEGSESVGKYRLYLDFVKMVGAKCGFNVEEDMLRIPSTKNVCFIGRTRSYNISSEAEIDEQRQNYIRSRCEKCSENNLYKPSTNSDTGSHTIDGAEGMWVSEFTPRNKTEVTRNCVTVKKETKDHVTRTVFDKVLGCDNCELRVMHDGRSWRKGGKLSVGKAVALFERDLLLELKSECGGLQTLLRNSCHIFQVSSGYVQLRDFTLKDPFEGRKKRGNDSDKTDFLKTTLCWFNDNHPDGCPKASVDCHYAHGLTELRPRPVKTKTK